MSDRVFSVVNRADLQAERELLPLAQLLLRALTSSGIVKRFHRMDGLLSTIDWMIFKDLAGNGFGARVADDEALASPLQRTLRFVRQAQATVKALGGPTAIPCVLTLDRQPPSKWGVWEIVGVAGTVWCASSTPVVRMPRRCVGTPRDPRVRVRMYGVVRNVPEHRAGFEVEFETIDLWMPEIGIRGRAKCGEKGMEIEVGEGSEVEEQSVPGVRLDLGEVEMRLSDLVGLRPGVTINLGEVALERCFVRLGATVLAEGRFRASNGQLLLTVESVL